MIALLVATMIAGNMLRSIVRHHQLVAESGLRLQAEWLVEAGLERGRAAVAAEPDYDGEVWTPSVDEQEARVTISVEGKTLTARAEYPVDVTRRATAERAVQLP